MWRFFTLGLLVYVALDFADPNMPGALNFDLNQSVDATYSEPRTIVPTTRAFVSSEVPSAQTLSAVAEKFDRPRPTVRVHIVRFDRKPHALRAAPVAPPPSDDH